MNYTKTNKEGEEVKIYKLSRNHIFLIILFSLFAIVAGFLSSFSLSKKVSTLVENNITKNRSCPMRAKEIDISLLFPSIAISDLEVSSVCLQSKSPLILKSINSSVSLPSISPFGAAITTNISDKYSKIDIFSIHNISGHYFKIESKKLKANSLQSVFPALSLGGLFELNANIEVLKNIVKDLSLHLKTNNFSIPSQNIEGFEIPDLKIGPMSLKSEIKTKNKLEILELIIGNELSPIRANIIGDISLNQFNIAQSTVDLTVTVKFSQVFLESFSILNLFLDSSKQDAQGFYKMKLSGPLTKLNKPEFLN